MRSEKGNCEGEVHPPAVKRAPEQLAAEQRDAEKPDDWRYAGAANPNALADHAEAGNRLSISQLAK